MRFEIHIGSDTGFAGNDKAQSKAVGRTRVSGEKFGEAVLASCSSQNPGGGTRDERALLGQTLSPCG